MSERNYTQQQPKGGGQKVVGGVIWFDLALEKGQRSEGDNLTKGGKGSKQGESDWQGRTGLVWKFG